MAQVGNLIRFLTKRRSAFDAELEQGLLRIGVLSAIVLYLAGALLFAAVVAFQLVTLPVEFDASFGRALPLLATTASATPFIGLFGTVWGIMNTFHAIGATGSTSITTVAPGIAEALVNTAAGLLAAIPAVVAYNHLLAKVRIMRRRMEDFELEFLNLVERNFN